MFLSLLSWLLSFGHRRKSAFTIMLRFSTLVTDPTTSVCQKSYFSVTLFAPNYSVLVSSTKMCILRYNKFVSALKILRRLLCTYKSRLICNFYYFFHEFLIDIYVSAEQNNMISDKSSLINNNCVSFVI